MFKAKVTDGVRTNLNVVVSKPLWPVNNLGESTYDDMFSATNTIRSMTLGRINPYWVEKLINVPYGSHNDNHKIELKRRVVLNGITAYDQIRDTGILYWKENKKDEVQIRVFMCQGSILDVNDFTSMNLGNIDGNDLTKICIPFDHPDEGRMLQRRYGNYTTHINVSMLRDLVHPTLPLCRDDSINLKKRYITLSGYRNMFIGQSHIVPFLVNRDSFGYLLEDPYEDDECMNSEEFIKILSFRD
jgi:hypothetical protein